MIYLAELPGLMNADAGIPDEASAGLLALRLFALAAYESAAKWCETGHSAVAEAETEVARLWRQRAPLEAAWRAHYDAAEVDEAACDVAYLALCDHDDALMAARPVSLSDLKLQAVVAVLHSDRAEFDEPSGFALVAAILRLGT